MRRILVAMHIVGLALWLGSLTFSVALAGLLFATISKPVCPGCMKSWTDSKELVACATCGALEHAKCAATEKGCALEHAGSHECRLLATLDVASPTSASPTGLSEWARVKVASDKISPERRLLWRLDGATLGLKDRDGNVPLVGSCFEQPRPGVGDALGVSFELSQGFAIACAVLALGSVLLTPPGGALRLFRTLALVGALVLAGVSLHMAGEIATKRLDRESFAGETPAQRENFGTAHGLSTVAGLGELALVLVALVLVTVKRDEDGSGRSQPDATPKLAPGSPKPTP